MREMVSPCSVNSEAGRVGESAEDALTSMSPVTECEAEENPISHFLYLTQRGKVVNLVAIASLLVFAVTLLNNDNYSTLNDNRHLLSVPYLLVYECSLHTVLLLAFLSSKAADSKSSRKVTATISSVLLFAVMLSDVHFAKLTEITRLWLSHETIRLQLKCISFLVESGNDKVRKSSDIWSFVYFLFAPTLLYQVNYPTSAHVRWNRVFNSIVWLLLTLAVVFPAFYQFILPHLIIDLTKITGTMILKNLLIFLPLPFFVYCFLVSFIYFEVWCGLIAELMKYSDHRFFGAYVKQRNAGDIFTSINSVVSNWIKRYIFVPLLKRTHSLLIAYTVTMSLSASYHEIVYCFTLKQFILMSHILGLAIGPQLLMKTTNRITRIIQISLFLFGFSTHFYPHILEYSARMYCEEAGEDTTFFRLVPLHVQCLKRVLLDE